MIDPDDLTDDGGWPTTWQLTGPNYYLPQLSATSDEEREWKQRAACRDKDPLWFLDAVNSWEIRRAKLICSACPVQAECRALADEIEPTNGDTVTADLAGVWAGESPAERQARRNGRTALPARAGGYRGRRGVVHGTNGCYIAGCREFECVDAHRIYMQDYRARRRAAGGASTRAGRRHGTDSCYESGCRLPSCVAAHSKAMREYRSRMKARQIAQEGAA